MYLEKKVKIDLTNGFFYEGIVIGYDEDSLTIRDRNNKIVSIKITSISFIREVGA